MSKRNRPKKHRPQHRRSSGQSPRLSPTAIEASMADSLRHATSPANRAKTRTYITQCGSPVLAAKGVYTAHASAADKITAGAQNIACRSGCWFCCTLPVSATVVEAALVMGAVEGLSQEEKESIWARLQDYIDAQNQTVAHADGKRIGFTRRCPLLTADGRCSVYAHRPLACRGLFSLDAERCRRAFLEDDNGDPTAPFLMRNDAITSGITQLMVTLQEGQLDFWNYDLASTLYVLWTNSTRFAEWQEGSRFAKDGFPRMADNGEIFPAPATLSTGLT